MCIFAYIIGIIKISNTKALKTSTFYFIMIFFIFRAKGFRAIVPFELAFVREKKTIEQTALGYIAFVVDHLN